MNSASRTESSPRRWPTSWGSAHQKKQAVSGCKRIKCLYEICSHSTLTTTGVCLRTYCIHNALSKRRPVAPLIQQGDEQAVGRLLGTRRHVLDTTWGSEFQYH